MNDCIPQRLKPSLIFLVRMARLEAAPFQGNIKTGAFISHYFFFHSSNLAGLVICITCWGAFRAVILSVLPNATGAIMNTAEFFEQLDARIGKYDLLCHPFYKAWSAGELDRDDLREYAQDYYHHVEAFPSYLAALGMRLEEGELRRAVLANMCDEKGVDGRPGRDSVPHSELWLDFAEGMGSSRNLDWHSPVPEIRELVRHFHQVASEGTPEEALAAFYAYESQVPRVAKEKERGLREMYGADDKTCGYFSLHATADVYHSRVWRKQLEKRIEANPETADAALDAAEKTARLLWKALDGIDARRMATAV
jgi:pyrroloquinoline-quinone synthase